MLDVVRLAARLPVPAVRLGCPVIEPTDEHIAAFDAAVDRELGYLHRPQAEVLRVGLAAVLAIVERDWNMQPRPEGSLFPPKRREHPPWTAGAPHLPGCPCVHCAVVRPRPQWPPGRGGQHPHYCVGCSDGEAAGPGCGDCRSTGMDQTPWPTCKECAS